MVYILVQSIYRKEKKMFINDALAQTADLASAASAAAASSPQTSMASTLVQLALIFLIFYFILIRPQQKKIAQHQTMLDAIKKGDKIVTGGGIYGTVTKADEEKLEVEIAKGIIITVSRATVRNVIDGEEPAAKPADKAVKKK